MGGQRVAPDAFAAFETHLLVVHQRKASEEVQQLAEDYQDAAVSHYAVVEFEFVEAGIGFVGMEVGSLLQKEAGRFEMEAGCSGIGVEGRSGTVGGHSETEEAHSGTEEVRPGMEVVRSGIGVDHSGIEVETLVRQVVGIAEVVQMPGYSGIEAALEG